jgi:L-fuculose-phosphate aldolase
MNRETLSQQIIDTCLEMTYLGLNQGTSGNVSVRYKNGMLITPSGTPYNKLTPSMIVYVDYEGKAELDKVPSSEWHFHLTCFEARPEMNAVIHNHAINSTAVSILNRDIPAIHYMVAVTGIDHVPCISYSTFGSQELADNVALGIKKSKAILMQHHGMLTMEINLEKALWLANEVEVLAKLYLQILSIQPDVPVLQIEEMKIVLEKFKTYGLKSE